MQEKAVKHPNDSKLHETPWNAIPQACVQREQKGCAPALLRDNDLAGLFWQWVFRVPVTVRPTQLGRFRKALGDEGAKELLVRTMEVAVTLKLIAKKELTRVILDFMVQEKSMTHPTDSKLLETPRSKVEEVANGIEPIIGHLKADHRMDSSVTSMGQSVMHCTLLCDAGYFHLLVSADDYQGRPKPFVMPAAAQRLGATSTRRLKRP